MLIHFHSSWFMLIRSHLFWFILIDFGSVRVMSLRSPYFWFILVRWDSFWFIGLSRVDSHYLILMRFGFIWLVVICFGLFLFVLNHLDSFLRSDTFFFFFEQVESCWFVLIHLCPDLAQGYIDVEKKIRTKHPASGQDLSWLNPYLDSACYDVLDIVFTDHPLAKQKMELVAFIEKAEGGLEKFLQDKVRIMTIVARSSRNLPGDDILNDKIDQATHIQVKSVLDPFILYTDKGYPHDDPTTNNLGHPKVVVLWTCNSGGGVLVTFI